MLVEAVSLVAGGGTPAAAAAAFSSSVVAVDAKTVTVFVARLPGRHVVVVVVVDAEGAKEAEGWESNRTRAAERRLRFIIVKCRVPWRNKVESDLTWSSGDGCCRS